MNPTLKEIYAELEYRNEERKMFDEKKRFKTNPLGTFVFRDVPQIEPPVEEKTPSGRKLSGVGIIWAATITTVVLVISTVLLVLVSAGVISW